MKNPEDTYGKQKKKSLKKSIEPERK